MNTPPSPSDRLPRHAPFARTVLALGLALVGALIALRAQPPQFASLPISQGLQLYSFRAIDVDMKQALALFARANHLNIIPDLEVGGTLTVDFQDLPLDLAMDALLDAHGYYFVKEGNLIRVKELETRLFELDYIQITRTGAGANHVSVSSGSSTGGGSGGGSGTEGSTAAVTSGSTVDFWATIRDQLTGMLTSTGTMSVNSLAGTIIVTDRRRNIQRVATYLDSISHIVNRQVELSIEIYEVAFRKGEQLGINWDYVSRNLDATFGARVINANPDFGSNPGSPAITINHQRGGLTAVLEALKHEGDLSVVSKPRIRTLNNQPAVIRVGQDYPFFLSQISQTTTAAGINRDVSETLQLVSIGTVLSITPRVSNEDIITLDITPAVTRLVGEVQSAELGNRAPIVDIRQAASIVRVKDGDTVTLAGLVQTSNAKNKRKIPVLGDIPGLGRVFTGTVDSEEKTELVIFITPRIIKE